MDALTVFLIALGTAVATGLGVVPVVLMRGRGAGSLSLSSALAAGFMLGASAGLFYEGVQRSVAETFLGAAVGVLFIALTRKLLHDHPAGHIGTLRGARGVTALMVVAVMTVHSFTEGAAVGVSFAGDHAFGLLIAIAIAVHNIPEGIAVSLTLIPYGESVRSAFLWSVFSSLPQPLMAVPAYLAATTFAPLLAGGLGFAGGAMVWMVVAYLIPEAFKGPSRPAAVLSLVVSTLLMIALEVVIGF
jgi:zinc transporter ZupT